jgi:hypothetical protein
MLDPDSTTHHGTDGPSVSTYFVESDWALAELDYRDMVALSGMFRRWAVYEAGEAMRPDQRTRMIQYSADFERIADFVGEGWISSAPSEDMPLPKFLALWERRNSNVVDLFPDV